MNIHRIPNGSRNFEYYSEDPELASELAVDWIEGLQGRGVIGDVKHYVANNQEGLPGGAGSRFRVNAVVDERTLREIYLQPSTPPSTRPAWARSWRPTTG